MKLDFKTPGLSKVLFVYGTRELPDTYVVKETIKEGMHVADIGANIGYYTLMEAHKVGNTGHVYAFEPDPRNISLLRENIALNQLMEKVTIYEQAVSNKRERKRFKLGERSNVSSFVDRDDTVGTVEVDCISLSEFEHIDKIDIIRMDAEGYECKIIEGLLPFLHQNRKPFMIMLEIHSSEYNDTDMNFKKVLKNLFDEGFAVTHLITSSRNRDQFTSREYTPVNTWTETRYSRDLYLHVSNEDVLHFLDRGMLRALLIARG